MKARHAIALFALMLSMGGPVTQDIFNGAREGWGNTSVEVSGDWVIWQDADGTVQEIRPAVPAPDEFDPVQGTEELIQFYNAAIADGSVFGTGAGRTAVNRANWLYYRLVEAQALNTAGDDAAALAVLKAVYRLCDGQPEPNDFIAGDERETFAAMVQARIALAEPFAFAARGDYLTDDVEFDGLVQAANNLPRGTHDGIDHSNTWGWACDADNYAQPVAIHFYMDGPAGGGGIFIGATTANVTRPDVASVCGGYAGHGFNFILPDGVKDGYQHWIYAYAISIGGGMNPLLTNSPKLFNELPRGFHDGIDQSNTWGWACDADNYAQPVAIHFYMDGPAGGGGIFIGATTANVTRPDVASVCGGYAGHGFNFTLPDGVKDGYQHWIYAYAISIGGGMNPLLTNSPKLFTRWRGMAALAVIGDSISRAFNANGDSVYDPSCSWGDDLRYSWFSNTSELGQCYEHNVYSVTERTLCVGANPLVVANFAWNGADMYTDAYTQAVQAKNWLIGQGTNRLVAILLGGNDICTNNKNVNEPCPNDPSGRLDSTNYCRPTTATFEKEVRRALDVLVTVPNTHIGVADPPRVSLLCRYESKSVGSGLECSTIWETATLFGAPGVCRSLTEDCSPARIAKANETFVNYRNAIERVVAEYAAVVPGAMIPANATFGTGNVTKALGVSLKRTEVFGKYLFQAVDISNCDCFHPYKTMQNKLAAWMFTGLQCSATQPCVREVGEDFIDGAGIYWDTTSYYSGLLP